MTTPEIVKPSNAKSWTALVGSVLTIAIPVLVQVQGWLPPPWPAVIGGVVAMLTWLGVYQAPYKPAGTVIVPAGSVPQQPLPGGGQDPWA